MDNKEERMKFCIEQAANEVDTTWTRTNVFLSLSTGGIGAVVAGMQSVTGICLFAIAAGGLVFTCTWLQVNRMSRYYADRWINDARRIASSVPDLKSDFFYSLGFREPKYDGDDVKIIESLDLRRPRGLSATKCMYIVISTFMVAWFSLLLLSIKQIMA